MLVFRAVWGFRRRITEGSPKGRREWILADINARPPDEREPGNCRDRIATHSGRDGAGGEKKEKAPKEKKAPNKKRENAACGSACLRAAAPPSSLASLPLLPLPLAAAPPPYPLFSPLSCLSFTSLLWRLRRPLPAPFSCPLRASLASCGRLRRPSPPLSCFSCLACSPRCCGRLRRPLSPLPFSRQRFAPPPPLARLSP